MGIKNVDECFDVYVTLTNSTGCVIKEEGFPTIEAARKYIKDELIDYIEIDDSINIFMVE